MANRPGGEMATRPLHFIWIVDCSGSMAGEKIQALNFAVREALPEMIKVADTQAQYAAAANLYAKAITMMKTAIGH